MRLERLRALEKQALKGKERVTKFKYFMYGHDAELLEWERLVKLAGYDLNDYLVIMLPPSPDEAERDYYSSLPELGKDTMQLLIG
jgi:hypothetical protein